LKYPTPPSLHQLLPPPSPETAHETLSPGTHPTKWDRSGTVVESPGYDQYRVEVDGSGRLTLRNRRFLRAYTPATPSILQQSPALSLPTGTVEHPSQPSSPSPPTRRQTTLQNVYVRRYTFVPLALPQGSAARFIFPLATQ